MDKMTKSNPRKETQIEKGPKEFNGYANLCRITVSTEEAILHFGQRLESDPNKGIGNARIYLSLPHAKRLAHSMLRALQAFEKSFGEIQEDPGKHLSPEGKQLFGIASEEIENDQ